MNAGLILYVFVFLPSIFLDTNAQIVSPTSSVNPKHSYIVYMAEKPANLSPKDYYIGVLSSALGSEKAAEEALLYAYRLFFGFSAVLSDEQVDRLKKQGGVVSVVEGGYASGNPILINT